MPKITKLITFASCSLVHSLAIADVTSVDLGLGVQFPASPTIFITDQYEPRPFAAGVFPDLNLQQSFTVTDDMSLKSVYLGYEFGVANAEFDLLVIRMTNADDSGTNGEVLLDTVVRMPSVVGSTEEVSTLRIDFTGLDSIALSPGQYGVILDGIATSPFAWVYDSTNPYPGGRAFPDSVAFKGGALATDFTMAIDGNSCITNLQADINNDGIVDAADLGILISTFGNSCP